MKFCDKLAKKRKENNLSQELLADKLKMSRQAISKWESGSSYPDMETIIKLCKIFNCPINELLDDDALGDMAPAKNNKFNISDVIKDLLKFITKSYNMFCAMKFKEKIKCIFEMVLITLIIIIAWSSMGSLFRNIFISITNFLPVETTDVLFSIFSILFETIGVALGFIIVIHLFKTRYLDYYVIIEDEDVEVKTTEEPIKENKTNLDSEKGFFKEAKKEKVIIRDPKHSSYSFINAFIKVIMFFVKCFLLFIAIFLIMSFIGLAFCTCFNIFYLKDGLIFVGTLIFFIGCLAINYIILKFIYNTIFNRSYHFLKGFIIFISGLLLIGFGLALSTNAYLKFDSNASMLPYMTKTTKTLEMSNNLVFPLANESEIVIDDTLEDIKVEFTGLKCEKFYLFEYDENNYKIARYRSEYDFICFTNLFIQTLKDKKAIEDNYEDNIKVYISSKNLEILNNNYNLRSDY